MEIDRFPLQCEFTQHQRLTLTQPQRTHNTHRLLGKPRRGRGFLRLDALQKSSSLAATDDVSSFFRPSFTTGQPTPTQPLQQRLVVAATAAEGGDGGTCMAKSCPSLPPFLPPY